MSDDAELAGLLEGLMYAHGLLAQGRLSEAQRVLLAVEAASAHVADVQLHFMLHRLLGQTARSEGRLADATAHYEKCREVADNEALRSAALEGLALTAAAEGRLKRAVRLFGDAAEAARAAGDSAGYAAVLQNHANIVTAHGLEGAEEPLRRALAVQGISASLRGVITDNLAHELARQGWLDEAAELAAQAARTLTDAGADLDAVKAWRHLADISRQAGREAESGTAFAHAHDLLKRIHDHVDVEHYGRLHDERVAQIEALTETHLREQISSEADLALEIGLNATMGRRLVDTAEQRFEEGDLAAAEALLIRAESHWEQLRAAHCMPQVWNLLGLVHLYAGAPDRALSVLSRSRHLAHALGDAMRECFALRHLAMVRSRFGLGEEEDLGLLLRARALSGFAARRRLAQVAPDLPDEALPDGGILIDGGVIDGKLAQICADYGAWELADTYSERALAAAERAEERFSHRLAVRLAVRLRILKETGRTEAAAETMERLAALGDRRPDDQTLMTAHTAIGWYRFETGERSPALLDHLVAACDAYEELRRRALDLGPLADFRTFLAPPYAEAVETALTLGHVAQAFDLVERAKGRSLLDAVRHTGSAAAVDSSDHGLLAREQELWQRQRALRAELSARPEGEDTEARVRRLIGWEQHLEEVRQELTGLWERLSAEYPEVRVHRMAEPITAAEAVRLLGRSGASALVEFWVGREALYAFVLEAGRTEPVLVSLGGHEALGRQQYADEVRALLAASSVEDQSAALDTIVRSPLHRAVRDVVEDAGGPGTPVLVVPHGLLHTVPLHLPSNVHLPSNAQERQPEPDRRSRPTRYLPSASLLRTGGGAWHRDGTVLAGGYPGTGSRKLTYYRGECAEVVDRLGGTAQFDEAATADWLETAVNSADRLSLVHLACHGMFDEQRPERSGLFLAGPAGPAGPATTEVVRTERLAAMDWTGALVTLSACSSGRHQVRQRDELVGLGRALLSAGARGLVVSMWPVVDRDAAILMSLFYEALASEPAWDADTVAGSLAGAQRRMASWTAADLIDWACSRLESPGRSADTDRLSFAALAFAHRRAGNQGEYDRWSAHSGGVEGTTPESQASDWWGQRHLASAGDGYLQRVFPSAAAWGAFAFYGA
ncbi:CHAT domain-containing protein [Streptomyces himalayensis]|uniref:CHAT domain-containing protein n=1 Tax=Streptomyces himalayensis subsp. himalayensis TaxID=2756131 RepID=A0A7W0DUL2_9ACTN|nr:CHAT domain-containing protein [Streptomyces himalayensis]MBA2951562.1 CHAT domain-containing protein [Streptomyces himalayensis subsp. himalayensis]